MEDLKRKGFKGAFAFVTLAVLAVISGIGNAVIIAIINSAVYGADSIHRQDLAKYFIVGIFVYLLSQKLLRTKFIHLTNNIIYSKRKEMTEKILNTSYRRFEQINTGKIYAGLNNDTEVISECANLMILGVTAATTILCCLIYLSTVYLVGLLIAVGVMSAAALLYVAVGQKARKLWNQTRDIQNIFFKFISDLIGGFKELAIHNDKKQEFKEDMFRQSKIFKEKKIDASVKFANAFVLGEFLFTSVIGSVVFIFPLLFQGISNQVLVSFVIIFLYMSSPVYTLLNMVPNLIQVKISWDRINGLIKDLTIEEAKIENAPAVKRGTVALEMKDLCYEYKDKQEKSFTVGPLNYQFRSGEIIFITGGNGSGKSTLAKLITGLYPPISGEITMNQNKIEPEQLGQYYSAVFSDCFLFDKLYGIDWAGKEKLMQEYMKLLQIDDKLTIESGVFGSIKLSTGQRKRLALLVSFLEDRQIYLFDEWAADQDPEFRKFFYHTLIFKLKELGKCVIAITHDDRYFELADKVIKMEMGKIVNE